jgi:O-acetyl-ADP-ribose deacetylase (regulator of RNase III)
MGRIVLLEGDITEQEVDAIVNAANSELVLGSGVAGAIREKGGPTIQEECDAIGAIAVGGAAITGAGELPARFVIHAAGMPPGGKADEASVRGSLRRSLELAEENGCRSVACPAIGTGVAGFPQQRCAEISLEIAREFLAREGSGEAGSLEEIRFVLFGEPAYRLFEMVNDAAKVQAQMERLARARTGGSGAGSGGET